MFGGRFISATSCSRWLHETEPARLDQSFSGRVLKVATHPAQVKTDSIHATTLSHLLPVDLIPRAHIPGAETQRLREKVRQRLLLVRLRTMVRNRIHALVDRYPIALPTVSELFGKKRRKYLSPVFLPDSAQHLLGQDLKLLDTLSTGYR